MSIMTFIRGHEVFIKANDDYTKEEVKVCAKCGRPPLPLDTETGYGIDSCLGFIPEAIAACCGHGDDDQAYIIFKNGTEIRGEEVEQWRLKTITK